MTTVTNGNKKTSDLITLELTNDQRALLKMVMRSALIANADDYFYAEAQKETATLAALQSRGLRLAAINDKLNAHV